MTDANAAHNLIGARTAAVILTEEPDISAFEAQWERLFALPGNEPSTSFEWTRALLRNQFAPVDRFCLVAITRGSKTIALVPLVARPTRVLRCPVRILCPISDLYNTHGDVLSSVMDDDVVQALLTALYDLPTRWDVFRMSNVLEAHSLVSHFGRAIERRPLSGQVRDSHASYMLELPESYADYLAARSAKFRNYLKRMERKICAEAKVNVTDITAVEDVPGAYEQVLEIERASWKHAHGTAISAVPHQIGFYRDLCEGAASRGRLHLQILALNGRPAAYNLGYARDSTYCYLKTSFAEEWRRVGVATFLRAQLIRSLIDRRLRLMDFPAEPYEWERQWTETVRWHKRLTLYRATPVAIGLSVADRLRHGTARKREVSHINPRAAGPR